MTPIVGPWSIEPEPDGVALRRSADAGAEPEWADVDVVPPQGSARRVVLLGESTARGWPFDTHQSPTMVLQRHLDGRGEFQCVDLAKAGAEPADLLATAAAAPLLRPSVIVSFAGNNWMLPPTLRDERVSAALAAGLRAGGYPGMRRAFLDTVLPAARAYLDLLVAASRAGARVVVVVPEFNLRGHVPPAELEVPVLPHPALSRWYALRASAAAALDGGRFEVVAALTEEMAGLDGGCSPVPGRLAGLAAVAVGDGAAARAAFERSRDSTVGLLVSSTPRVTRWVQDALVAAAREHGFACVDLREVLAAPDLPQLPDEECFHDYCHLSGAGIERSMVAVADAVLGRRAAVPGPGVPPLVRAFRKARAAAYLALLGQPPSVVSAQLRAALDADPAVRPTLLDVRDVLAAPHPAWAHPATQRLAADPQVRQFVPTLAGGDGLCGGMWTLRSCLEEVLGCGPGVDQLELLTPTTADGFQLPNLTPTRAHHVACSSTSVLAFALARPSTGTLTLVHRSRHAPPGATLTLSCNGESLGELPAAPTWCTARVPVEHTRSGVNWLRVHWPVPDQDAEAARREDAEALDRREFPQVLPVFGELHEARLVLSDAEEPSANDELSDAGLGLAAG